MSTGLTTIFRVQDAAGHGPFQPGFTLQWFQGRDDIEADALAPFDQSAVIAAIRPLDRSHTHIAYGCLTIAQLTRWFLPVEYHTLRSRGYVAVSMLVDEILLQSPTQCLFSRPMDLTRGCHVFPLYPHA